MQDSTSRGKQALATRYPPGCKLRHTLRSLGRNTIEQLAWSPDGQTLAFVDSTTTIHLLNAETGQFLRILTHGVNSRPWTDRMYNTICWSPDGHTIASGSLDAFKLWDTATGQLLHTLARAAYSPTWSPGGKIAFSKETTIEIRDAQTGQLLLTLWDSQNTFDFFSLAWSPTNPAWLASMRYDHTVQLWDTITGKLLYTIDENKLIFGLPLLPSNLIWKEPLPSNVAWSLGGKLLAWGNNSTIQFWDTGTQRLVGNLEGHTSPVASIAFSSDGNFLASQSLDSTVRLWYSVSRETVAEFPGSLSRGLYQKSALAFSPNAPVLAYIAEDNHTVHIVDLDFATILNTSPATRTVHYTNAKVVLLGDSGVGKSGLGLVLSQQPFVPTESTHGRNVWTFDSQDVELDGGRKETRETLLWDLAGQPGYRLVHQLHLNEVAVALVVFDARSETDPFAGVYHWNRALEQAQRVQGSSAPPMKKFLVASRMDRGGVGVSRDRINSLLREAGFDGYFETSAKAGWGIEDLKKAIQGAIQWDTLPWVSSTDLFQRIKNFLIAEKEAGRLQSAPGDLYRAFLQSDSSLTKIDNLQAQFETCIGRVESRGLIRRLSFGNLVLLQPELLDAYASALINAVKEEPDGLGSIAEERVLTANFVMSESERIKDREQEKLLLIAMVEDLLRYEIALREQADEGPYLIFPSQSTRENPDLPDPEGKTAVFSFEGPVLNIYATLAVRLSHSGQFKKKELWKNAATYTARAGGTCGIFLRNIGEGRGDLTLFFDKATSEETRFHFDEYIAAHLKRRALPESIKRRRMFACSGCTAVVTEQVVRLRLERHFNWLDCPVCGERISLLDREERLKEATSSLVQEMDRAADTQRDRETVQTSLQGKIKTRDFDVFLCHNGTDKPAVKKLGEQLKEKGILPWLDEWELRPGFPWQPLLEQQIKHIKSAAVIVGKNGRGPWQDKELYAFLRQFLKRDCPVIPVILPDCENAPELPPFLEGMTWVDFRKREPDPIELLIWGITGKREAIR